MTLNQSFTGNEDWGKGGAKQSVLNFYDISLFRLFLPAFTDIKCKIAVLSYGCITLNYAVENDSKIDLQTPFFSLAHMNTSGGVQPDWSNLFSLFSLQYIIKDPEISSDTLNSEKKGTASEKN